MGQINSYVGLIESAKTDRNGTISAINLRTDDGKTHYVDRLRSFPELLGHVGWRAKLTGYSKVEQGVSIIELIEFEIL